MPDYLISFLLLHILPSITQQLQTDLGLSVGVTTAIQLVSFNRFTGSVSVF